MLEKLIYWTSIPLERYQNTSGCPIVSLRTLKLSNPLHNNIHLYLKIRLIHLVRTQNIPKDLYFLPPDTHDTHTKV